MILLLFQIGVRSPESTVKGYLDAKVKGESGVAYLQLGMIDSKVQGFVVKGYEIKNVSGDTVSVTVIFLSQGGTDIRQTLVFKVLNGEIVDIR